MKSLLIHTILLISGSVFGCSCFPISDVKTSYKTSDVVLSAKVVEVIPPKVDTVILKDGSQVYTGQAYGNIYKFELISIYKGKKMSRYFTLEKNESNCAYRFLEGETYLIYGYSNKGNIATNRCTRTNTLVDNKDLEYLNKKLKKHRTRRSKNNSSQIKT